jgi:hypothetical protein
MTKEEAVNYLVPNAVFTTLYYAADVPVTPETKQILLSQNYSEEYIDSNIHREFIIWLDERPRPSDEDIQSAMEIILPPQIVSMKKFRLALLQENLLSQVDGAIDTLNEPQRSELRIEWDYSTYVDRTASWISLFQQVMNLSEEQMDDLFIASKEDESLLGNN